MKRVHLFSHSICKHYTAPRWSFEYILTLLCTVLTFTLPFFLCISPRYALNGDSTQSNTLLRDTSTIATPVGVWLKHDTYREQPKVKFQYKVIFIAQIKNKILQEIDGKIIESFTSKELYYSTIDGMNELRTETFRAASTTSREIDNDFDGVMDRLLMEIKMPLKANEYVHGIQFIALLNYRLDTHVRMEMESLFYLHHESGLAGSKFSSTGDLNLRQMRPIPIINTSNDETDKSNIWKLYSDEALLEYDNIGVNSSQSNVMQIQKIIEKYQSRSIATDYVERFPVWFTEIEEDINVEPKAGNEYLKDFELSLTVDIPKMQSIVYVPTLMEVLSEAWIRYLSLLVITGFLVRRALFFLFTNHFMKTKIIMH